MSCDEANVRKRQDRVLCVEARTMCVSCGKGNLLEWRHRTFSAAESIKKKKKGMSIARGVRRAKGEGFTEE